MLKAIKKFLGIKEKVTWNWDSHELARVAPGTCIIDNNGRTEGGPATEWTKNSDGTWAGAEPSVKDSYFSMPFMVVKEAAESRFDKYEKNA